MKYFLIIILALIGYTSISQTPYPTPYTQQGSPSTLVQVRGGWKADSTAMMPKYVDTITANLYKTKLYAGSIIFTTSDGNYWYRSADAARWLLFGNSVTNCLGTQLISGSITWSGSGLIFDATDLDYSIICTRYSSSATTLTLSTADPTYARIDKLYADITGNVGVITGTPAPNPQEPVINPLSQLDMGIVYIPAGSTVPAGTTQTIIYNENVEFIGTSDVPSINFAYATNPYIGSLSTYIPSAPNSSYVEWQSNGIDYLFSEAQYLKFWVRLNADFTTDPLSFLDVTFEYTDVTVSQTLSVGNGDYNMDYSLINQWQLVSIPLTGITTFGASFNSVHFVINSAPTSFQLDYVYLLETATVPPVISSGWSLNLNTGTNPTTNGIGTSDSVGVAIKTNSETRAIMPANGLQLVDDTTYRVMVWNETTKEWAVTYQPTILADSPVIIYQDVYQDRIKADTSRRGAALATQYYADSVGGTKWSTVGNAGTTAGANFIGTTDNVGLMFKVNNVQAGYINTIRLNTSLGYQTLLNNTTGTENVALGYISMRSNTTGAANVGIGSGALLDNTTGLDNVAIGATAGVSNTTGRRNTFIGSQAAGTTGTTDSSIALGFAASAASKQLAISPVINEIKATGITGASNSGYVLTTNGSGIATFQAASGGGGTPAGNYGNIQINRNGAFDTPGGDSLSFNESTTTLNVIGGIRAADAVGAETPAPSYIKTTNDLLLGDVTNGVYAQISGSNADNILRLYSTGGNPMELHDDVTVIGNITAHNIIGATATQTDANFSATAGTAYVLSGNNSATRTITMPTLAEGDVFEFYNENTSANKWVSSATIYLSDNTTFTTLADDTNYILRYVGGKLRVSN